MCYVWILEVIDWFITSRFANAVTKVIYWIGKLCGRYLGHCSLYVSQTWLLLQHEVLILATCYQDSKLPKHFVYRTNSNAFFSLFCLQQGQTKWHHCMLAPTTPTISGFTARKMFQLSTRLHGWGHWTPKLHRQRGAINRRDTPL